MEQTAVDWFFEQLTEVDYNCINKTFLQNNNSLAGYRLRELYEQAKEMEKQQIIDAINLPREKRWYNALLYNNSGEQYYNETFKNK
jgi:hypothetical protein